MLSAAVDHLVITAPSLDAGTKMLHEALGIWPQPGGEHMRMGTHNVLLRLGETLYLEVIAINPAMAKPNRPRWFGVDELAAESVPRLATWVARCADIHAAHTACGAIHGEIEAMSRGDLNWLISIAEDGRMPFDGVAPSLIQWQSPQHPASSLEDRGCSLVSLKGVHPDAATLNILLQKLGMSPGISFNSGQSPHLIAEIQTPSGIRTIGA
jgi:Glyoxalase-like domain